MAETNFYSYMFAQASEAVAFDELAEIVDLSSPESIHSAFISYLDDYTLPIEGIKDVLKEERFIGVESEINAGHHKAIQYEVYIPGIDGDADVGSLQSYLEEFLDKIGVENTSEGGYKVDVKVSDDERGGVDLNVFISLFGSAIKKGVTGNV